MRRQTRREWSTRRRSAVMAPQATATTRAASQPGSTRRKPSTAARLAAPSARSIATAAPSEAASSIAFRGAPRQLSRGQPPARASRTSSRDARFTTQAGRSGGPRRAHDTFRFRRARDHVDQYADQRQEDDKECPSRLGPAGVIAPPEVVRQDQDQEPDPDDPCEEDEHRPHDVEERITGSNEHSRALSFAD